MTYSPEEMLLSLIPMMLHDQAREYLAELGARPAATATCDASTDVPTFGTVGPCVLHRHHPGPVHKAADGATWSQVLPFPCDEVRCMGCDELEDDCTCRLDDEAEVCPTACEPECRDVCHEDHHPPGERGHEPDDCPGFRPTRWPFWPRNPSWMGKPLPTMRETAQQALNDLAERGILLVVPGHDTPPAPTWPYGAARGDWVTVFANDWPDDPPPAREMSAAETERLDAETATSGVDTPGCDCGHDGLGLRWHARDCAWRKGER